MQTHEQQERHTVIEKITIEAAADTVWERLRNFNALQDWHPAVAASPADRNNTVGSVRTLALQGGGEIVETLLAHSDAERSYSYSAKDGGALPVTSYVSKLQVSAEGPSRAVVEWRGDFYAVTPDIEPPAEHNDEATVKIITGVYQAGLINLKKQLEPR